MAADVLLVADALASKFTLIFANAGVTNTTTSREYEVTRDLGAFAGRKVDVFPLTYNPVEQVTRDESAYDFRFAIVTMERYTEKGLVPKSWIDERVNFVEERIFNPLDPTGKTTKTALFLVVNGDEYWPDQVEVTSVFDYDLLRQNKVFWSEVEVTFRKIDTGLN